MKLKALHEDILGDVKRKLKGQVSRADTVERVAKQALKTAAIQVDTLVELLDRTGVLKQNKEKRLVQDLKKGLKDAQKDLDRIK
jgi:hypothetical protein